MKKYPGVVLIVDDIVDSGESISVAMQEVMAAGTKILHKRREGPFTTGTLDEGEFGVDVLNGDVYYSADGTGVIRVSKGGHAHAISDTTGLQTACSLRFHSANYLEE